MPVQELPGTGTPFDRLVKFITAGKFEATTIDAPFSLPSRHLPPGGHAELLRSIRELPNASDRGFPLGSDIVLLGENVMKKHQHEPKPLRETERYWAERGVNTRSTMWSGARGGAPFAAACLRLLELAGRPIWPWHDPQPGILGEAFPAAQLFEWGLPHRAYSKPDQTATRKVIVRGLSTRLSMDPVDERKLLDSPDALDATIAAFAAIAVSKGEVANFSKFSEEGFIVVAK
jgi:predicted nuclease with RNAse H fold